MSALLMLMLSGCNLNISATRTPVATVGTTVFSIVRWRDPGTAIDVVFVADQGYGNLSVIANRQAFLDDVADIIDTGYWQNEGIVSNLGLFNFWYSTAAGGRVQAPTSGICPAITWPSLTDAAFAESVVIVHQTGLRDCGGGARSSSLAGSGNEWISVHEFGHAAFGLPDEYCCDGGYWNVSPILYSTQAACTGDAANAAWRNCQSFTGIGGRGTWWRSEDTTVDLMSAGGPPTWELGRADWVVVRGVLTALSSASVNNPSTFAPADWTWP
jgi:hypothetical protein